MVMRRTPTGTLLSKADLASRITIGWPRRCTPLTMLAPWSRTVVFVSLRKLMLTVCGSPPFWADAWFAPNASRASVLAAAISNVGTKRIMIGQPRRNLFSLVKRTKKWALRQKNNITFRRVISVHMYSIMPQEQARRGIHKQKASEAFAQRLRVRTLE